MKRALVVDPPLEPLTGLGNQDDRTPEWRNDADLSTRRACRRDCGMKPRILGVGREFTDFTDVCGYYVVSAYYVQRELRQRVDFTMVPGLSGIDARGFDHAIGFGLRYFDRRCAPSEIARLRKQIKGVAAQFEDSPREKSTANLLLVAKDKPKPRDRAFSPYRVIGWAASPDECQSHQANDTLGILIDHPDYDPNRPDWTPAINQQIEKLKRSGLWRKKFKAVSIDVLTTPRAGGPVVTFDQISRKYWRAHIFIVTHAESVGASVIEAAVSGALIVAPIGFIDESLLRTVRHVTFSKEIPWVRVLSKINPAASRLRASEQSWSALTGRVLKALTEFRK